MLKECNHTEYRATLSYSQLSGEFYADVINQKKDSLLEDFTSRPVNEVKAHESFVSVNIYYDSISYTVSNESPQMDIVALIAAIGGNLGLFLGVSVFSICELIQVIIEIFFIKYSK